jgi:hypothetical protein
MTKMDWLGVVQLAVSVAIWIGITVRVMRLPRADR